MRIEGTESPETSDSEEDHQETVLEGATAACKFRRAMFSNMSC
jgi:hypothetical protein